MAGIGLVHEHFTGKKQKTILQSSFFLKIYTFVAIISIRDHCEYVFVMVVVGGFDVTRA